MTKKVRERHLTRQYEGDWTSKQTDQKQETTD